jgi:hypothetical protein
MREIVCPAPMTVPGKGGRPARGKRRHIKLTDEEWSFLQQLGGERREAAVGLRRLIAYARQLDIRADEHDARRKSVTYRQHLSLWKGSGLRRR